MPALRVPAPLSPGATVGVTAPSQGVRAALRPRLAHCEQSVRARGLQVRLGDCLLGEGVVSAPAPARAAELMAFLTEPGVDAVMPPWGGELLIEILPLLDFEALAAAPPKWFVGWSDCSTFMLPLLLRSGWLSLHGMNFMDSAFAPAPGAAAWWDVVALPPGASFTQQGLAQRQGTWRSYVEHPGVSEYALELPTRWRILGPERAVAAEGRLIGGCADVLARLAGTPYGEVDRLQAPEGLVLYLENCEMPPVEAARCWHQLALAGWFDRASAVLIGRTPAPDTEAYTQHQALADALGRVAARGVPVLYDVDIGHQPPQLLVVNGAQARVTYDGAGGGTLVQRLG